MLTKELLDRGLSLVERERTTRWDWGDWAVEVAGPTGEWGPRNGATAKLAEATSELAQEREVSLLDLPTVGQLKYYRDAASAFPPELRDSLRSMEAARKLAQKVPDLRERHRLVEQLKNDEGIVTVRAVREHFGMASKDGTVAQQAEVQRVRAEAAEERLSAVEAIADHRGEHHEPTVKELLGGEPLPDFGAAWADKLVMRVNGNALSLTSLVEREGLVFSPGCDLDAMYDYLLEAERQIADVRAAVQERIRDQKAVI